MLVPCDNSLRFRATAHPVAFVNSNFSPVLFRFCFILLFAKHLQCEFMLVLRKKRKRIFARVSFEYLKFVTLCQIESNGLMIAVVYEWNVSFCTKVLLVVYLASRFVGFCKVLFSFSKFLNTEVRCLTFTQAATIYLIYDRQPRV